MISPIGGPLSPLSQSTQPPKTQLQELITGMKKEPAGRESWNLYICYKDRMNNAINCIKDVSQKLRESSPIEYSNVMKELEDAEGEFKKGINEIDSPKKESFENGKACFDKAVAHLEEAEKLL